MNDCNLKAKNIKPSKRLSLYGTLFCLGMTIFIPSLGMSIVHVVLPTLVSELETTLSNANWVVISYLFSITSLVLVGGVLGDRFGRKRLILISLGIFIFASVFAALSSNIWTLIGVRMAQGIGAAFLLSQSFALAGTALPKNKTGEAMGLLGTMAATGTALGPVVGGLIVEWFNWSFIFWAMLPLSVVSYYFCHVFLPEDNKEKAESKRLDLISTVLLCTSLFCFTLLISSSASLSSQTSTGLLGVFALCLSLFINRQKDNEDALIRLNLFRNMYRNTLLVASFLVDATAMATLVVGPFYLTYVTNLSPANVGLVMAIGPFVGALSGYPAGRIVDYCGSAKALIFGLCQVGVGVLCYASLPLFFGVYGYIVALFIMTPGRQLFHAANSTYVINSVTNSEKGQASGLLNLSRNLGLMTGASIGGALFALFLGTEVVSSVTLEQLNTAYASTFSIVFCLLMFSIFGILYTNRRP
ncbi:MAG: MFS transporter [Alteromonadaceae bacterium]|nr:MFS transporter [Alteromonadaceae bacterium]